MTQQNEPSKAAMEAEDFLCEDPDCKRTRIKFSKQDFAKIRALEGAAAKMAEFIRGEPCRCETHVAKDGAILTLTCTRCGALAAYEAARGK